jgi:hypothetical protein
MCELTLAVSHPPPTHTHTQEKNMWFKRSHPRRSLI